MKASVPTIKRVFPCFIAILLAFHGNAEESIKIGSSLVHTNSVYDGNMASGTSAFEFDFKGMLPSDSMAQIWCSIDGKEMILNHKNGKIRINTTAGAHIFQFNINLNYKTAYSDSLQVASNFVAFYDVYLTSNTLIQAKTCKPVIYLYPEKTQEVSVQVDIFGNSPFYYPRYEDGWKVTAQPDGLLLFNEERYRYLFWEANQDDHLASISINKGFVVEGPNVQAFLEEKLTAIGFTSEEKADFITFWGPKMAALEQSYVRFEWNESCDKFAELNITPQPDQLFRFYIFIAPVTESFVVSPQQLPTFKRSGFTVLEWGGQFSNLSLNKAL